MTLVFLGNRNASEIGKDDALEYNNLATVVNDGGEAGGGERYN